MAALTVLLPGTSSDRFIIQKNVQMFSQLSIVVLNYVFIYQDISI